MNVCAILELRASFKSANQDFSLLDPKQRQVWWKEADLMSLIDTDRLYTYHVTCMCIAIRKSIDRT